MSDNVSSISEIVGPPPDGVDPAIRNAITRASRTLRNLDWFEVAEIRGYIGDGGIEHYQVRLKAGLRLEDEGGDGAPWRAPARTTGRPTPRARRATPASA